MISALKHGVICILLMSPLVASRASIAGEVQPPAAALADAIAAARPALVRLSVVVSEFEGGREVRREASGSGFIVTPEGHVLASCWTGYR